MGYRTPVRSVRLHCLQNLDISASVTDINVDSPARLPMELTLPFEAVTMRLPLGSETARGSYRVVLLSDLTNQAFGFAVSYPHP
jgi:hypothetical protein